MFTYILLFVAIVGWGLFLYSLKTKKQNKLQLQPLEVFNAQASEKESNLNKEMERLSIVARQTENAIMIMDPDGNIEWVNEGFTKMYGYTFEEFTAELGTNIRQTSFNSDIEEKIYKCTKLGQSVTYEALNITKNGQELWTHTSLTPIYNDNGDLAYLAAIDSDISRRKESSDELLKAIEQLSSRINKLSEQQKELIKSSSEMMERIEASGHLLEDTISVVKFINETSDKIKILGFNASIEAANMQSMVNNFNKSGFSGNGFRIIATEIIKLSEDFKKQASRVSNVMDELRVSYDHIGNHRVTSDNVSTSFFQTVNEVRKELLKVEMVADRLNN